MSQQTEPDYLDALENRVQYSDGWDDCPDLNFRHLVALCRKQQNELDALRADVTALRADVVELPIG
jgi:hypothetical protein